MAHNFKYTKDFPVVQTTAGKLRGFQLDDTLIFQGVEYAYADRFQAPVPVKPWKGIKDATSYGYVAPLMHIDQPQGELMCPHRFWPMNEHCQSLNIWTPTLDPDAKKPVMVWLHGGGFSAGSSIEQVAYDGQALSEFGDIVVVSLNHRLNILGYLDLAPFGEKYRNSGNAGNADMVAALQWIHDNIAGFGGDPENVTLFGQSGGGMKVWTLMQTPAADGLFHKGIIMSGVIKSILDPNPGDGTEIVTAMMKELGFTNVAQLETAPYEDLVKAYDKVSPELARAGKYIGNNPQPNDWYLGDPKVVGFTEHAKTIPVMIGSVLGEFLAFAKGYEGRHTTDFAPAVQKKYGDKADRMIELFKEAYPDKPLCDLLTLDSIFREPGIEFALKKGAHPASPTYSYLFTYELPLEEGKAPWHCSDIPFFFHNTALAPYCNNGAETDTLQHQMAGCFVNFARTGCPETADLPAWPACTGEDEAVMLLDKTCRVVHNHDHELIKLHGSFPMAWPPAGDDEEEVQIQH